MTPTEETVPAGGEGRRESDGRAPRDRGPNHHGEAVREFLKNNRRLCLEMLPPWAPDHNPVEAVWSWLKYGELADFAPLDLEQLDDKIVDRLLDLKFAPGLLKALWDRSELPFPMKDE